jgi:hypothetical protein
MPIPSDTCFPDRTNRSCQVDESGFFQPLAAYRGEPVHRKGSILAQSCIVQTSFPRFLSLELMCHVGGCFAILFLGLQVATCID